MAEEAEAKSKEVFSAGDFPTAIRHFFEAINQPPTNHVLYSNRSVAYVSINKYSEALTDAKKTVELKPDWSKGYRRLGAAHLGLAHYDGVVSAYKKGLEYDPNNEALKSGLTDAQASDSRSRAGPPLPENNLFGDAFSGPEMWAKLIADPSTGAYLQQPDFVKMMKTERQRETNEGEEREKTN